MHRLPLPLRLFLFLLIAILMAVLSLTAVFCLPNQLVRENVDVSLYYINSVEGISYPNYFHSNPTPLRIDNYSNNLMVEACVKDEAHSALYNAMHVQDYARYWHGYLLFLRPLMCLGSIELIRYLNMLLLMLLFLSVFYALARRIDFFAALAFGIATLAVWFFLVPMSLQYASVFYITFLFLICLLCFCDRLTPDALSVLFFAVGMITSFFDLLTVPLLTLGMPLVTLNGLALTRPLPIGKPSLKKTLRLSLLWGIGYGTFWASKWVFGSLILGSNVFISAASAALMRLNVRGFAPAADHYDRVTVILSNIKKLFPSFPSSFLAMAAVVCLVSLVFALAYSLVHRKKSEARTPLRQLLPFLLVSAYPFLWYCVLANHSGKHAFFTCKLLAITIFGGLMLLIFFLRGRGPKKAFQPSVLSPASPLQNGKKPI